MLWLLAIALGLVLGYVLQKGGFCMNTAFRSIVFEKNRFVLRSWILVLLINLILVHLMDELAVITITRTPLFWLAIPVGSLVFGVGMVLAGGCTSGSCYRAGKGMLGSSAALIGFLLAALLFSGGTLEPVLRALREPVLDIQGEAASVWNLFGIDYTPWKWIIIAAVSVLTLIWLIKTPPQKYLIGWNWWITGTAIGIIAVLAWVLGAMEYRDYGLSFTQPLRSWGQFLLRGDAGGLNTASFIILAVPVGAFAAALQAGEFRMSLPEPRRFTLQFVGGMLMGGGASVAGGCNIGHGITGVSTFSLGSIFATLVTMLSVWMTTALIFRIEKSGKNKL